MSPDVIIQAIVSGLLMGLIYALVAVGLSLIFGLMEIVNFAHGEFLMLSMYFSFFLWALVGLDPLLSLPIVVLALALFGLATHYGIAASTAGSNYHVRVLRCGRRRRRPSPPYRSA